MTLFEQEGLIKAQLMLLTSVMEQGGLTLEEWDIYLGEMADAYKALAKVTKQIIN